MNEGWHDWTLVGMFIAFAVYMIVRFFLAPYDGD